ncbi:hypothetical protein AKJ52_01420 [candidate division MSBL1 archaeon SCGC-AAA382C18]|uniref:ACT domain-containing protein n=1 Tax=candidate division MSBL1 archaeon SCGC-AAA382C18 TaxID=1698281 RepID=A0A133VK98_9EURY|nr:hypothetical protein AKJ52_01420 [candidate division MSBL1 archaeon SCGC-AAA382C18]
MEMELEDAPGELVKVLDPISRYGANIQNVVHKREEKTPLGKVPVTIILEVKEEQRLEEIVDEIKEAGARIARVGEEEVVAKAVNLLVGDIVKTDIKDTVERLNSVQGARVSDLNLAVGKSGGESSARLIFEATSKESLKNVTDKLEEIAKEKDLLVIEPLE